MFVDEELIPISALQHWAFCPRQCALIHLEQSWAENARTASGRLMHSRTHETQAEWRGDVRIVRSLPLRSLRLGLTGKADVVEFHPADAARCISARQNAEPFARRSTCSAASSPPRRETTIAGLEGLWTVFPVEYKRGRPKKNDCDRIQLCAQAMCLEDMLDVEVPGGALFYGRQKRRTEVAFDSSLRAVTEDTIAAVRNLLAQADLPPPNYSPTCRSCSLINLCLPERTGRRRAVARNYQRRMIAASLDDAPSQEPPHEEA